MLVDQPDESLWHIIINDYYPKLVNMIYYLTRDWHAAEDIVQEAFAKAISSFHKLKDPNKFKPWLTRIALNTGKSWVMRNSHISYFAEIEVAASSFDLQLEEVINAETRKVVVDAISCLSPQEQKVVVLRFYLDLLEKDIANILGISEGTVKTVLHRSKKKLYRHLSIWYEKERDGRGR